MAKREFLQLAHKYNPDKHGIGGYWYSKKLDGMRAFWDGGISKGIPKSDVPWANTDKDYRYKKQQVATGLWSRYGHVVHAPDGWTDVLPPCPLDGELWNPTLSRQQIMSIVKTQSPGEGWKNIRLHVYDIPPLQTIFSHGKINNINYKKLFDEYDIISWIHEREADGFIYRDIPPTTVLFRTSYHQIQAYGSNNAMFPHTQFQLPHQTNLAEEHLNNRLLELTPYEDGLIIRHPDKVWTPERCHHILKMKPWDDDEATVIGYITGRETDKGSRLLGMMGAMLVDWKGKIFEISGFTDDERKLVATDIDAFEWAKKNPETRCPNHVWAKYFHLGSEITFRYRGLSDDGIPQEARYWRKNECNNS